MDIIVPTQRVLLLFHIVNGQFMNLTNGSEKLALRYGFHQTSECNNYEKAFLCIQKCVDKGYNLAYSDKYCFCTCYLKKEKAKYTPAHQSDRTRWKLGTPKTRKPAWIQKLANQSKDLDYVIVSKKKKGNTTNIPEVTNTTDNINLIDGKNIVSNLNGTKVINILSESQNLTASDNTGDSSILTDNQILTSVENGTVNAVENLASDKNATANEKLGSSSNKTDIADVETDGQRESNTTNATDNDSINITNDNNSTT